jgi:transglutaminase-like putative cysteine protease
VYAMSRPLIQRGPLSPGQRGTVETLALMSQLAREGSVNPDVRRFVAQLLDQRGTGRSPLETIRTLFDFVQNDVAYLRDHPNVEELRTVPRALRERRGDCDDKSTLLAALLMAARVPVRLFWRVIGMRPGSDAFSHVYVVAHLAGQRLALDTTHTGSRFGWEFPSPAIAAEVPV